MYTLERCIASNPNVSAEILEALAGIQPVRSSVAANPNTPKEVLIFLANDSEGYVRRNVAENPNTPEEILAILATDEEEFVRSGVVKNPNTPATTLTLLANDENNSYASLLLIHPKLNDYDFLMILEKEYEECRDDEENEEDAWNSFCELLFDIFSHLKGTVRSHRAALLKKASFYNESLEVLDPNASSEKLESLAYHENEFIRWEVASHSNTSAETFNLLSDEESLSPALAYNPNVPVETFIKVIANFALDMDCMRLREELSTDMLKELMSHPAPAIRAYVAIHPNTSCEMLEYLANDPDSMVRESVLSAKNLSLKICQKMSTELLERQYFSIEDGVSSKIILSFMANSQSEIVRAAVAKNFNTPTRILKILAKDNSEKVRMGVAQNPNTSLATLMQLANVSLE